MFASDAHADNILCLVDAVMKTISKIAVEISKKDPNHSNYSVACLINKTLSIASCLVFQSSF